MTSLLDEFKRMEDLAAVYLRHVIDEMGLPATVSRDNEKLRAVAERVSRRTGLLVMDERAAAVRTDYCRYYDYLEAESERRRHAAERGSESDDEIPF